MIQLFEKPCLKFNWIQFMKFCKTTNEWLSGAELRALDFHSGGLGFEAPYCPAIGRALWCLAGLKIVRLLLIAVFGKLHCNHMAGGHTGVTWGLNKKLYMKIIYYTRLLYSFIVHKVVSKTHIPKSFYGISSIIYTWYSHPRFTGHFRGKKKCTVNWGPGK